MDAGAGVLRAVLHAGLYDFETWFRILENVFGERGRGAGAGVMRGKYATHSQQAPKGVDTVARIQWWEMDRYFSPLNTEY